MGGPARELVEIGLDAQLVASVMAADDASEPLLVIAGGSNLVIADEGFDGTAIHLVTRGVASTRDGERVRLQVAAGEPWDELVSRAVADGLSGVECLSGIPGSAGATPIQNVGAYGQQVSDTIVSVRAYDRTTRQVVDLARGDCQFTYRSSRFRHNARYVVLNVTFELERSAQAAPIRYPELARALGVSPGERPPLTEVREAVLGLRRGKGMVLDPDDPDSVSAGSFFLNPLLSADELAAFERRLSELGDGMRPPVWPEGDETVKTSAAWLIEHAGFHRGYRQGRAGLSSKHTLALVNRGGARTSELIALAREIRDRVREVFGVELRPEPTLVGVAL